MIANGGSIGTGLCCLWRNHFASRSRRALLSYILIGLMVYFLMTSSASWRRLCWYPVPSLPGQNYVEGFGFALGWNYCTTGRDDRWLGLGQLGIELPALTLGLIWARLVPRHHVPELDLGARLWRGGILVR